MIKNIFNTLYGYATYKPPNRGNQFKKMKSTPKMAFQVPIIAPTPIAVKLHLPRTFFNSLFFISASKAATGLTLQIDITNYLKFEFQK